MSVAASMSPRQRARRTTGGVDLGRESSREARQLAAAILDVLAGQRTPAQAAQALGISLVRYYQLEAGGLRGLLAACEPKRKGRQPNLEGELAGLRKDNARLQRDLARQQALVRLTQRAAGLAAPIAPPPKPAGQKARKRKPVARAATVAARLREEGSAVAAPGSDIAVSSSAK